MAKLDLQALSTEQCKFGNCSLTITGDMNRQEWMNIGRGLAKINGAIQFWIGDWARYGDKRGFYTDSSVYAQIEKATGYDHGTIKNYTSIAGLVPSSRRRDDLSYSHHVEVARLTEFDQASYLRFASERKMSVRDLREKIRSDHLPREQGKMDFTTEEERKAESARIRKVAEDLNSEPTGKIWEDDQETETDPRAQQIIDDMLSNHGETLSIKAKLQIAGREENNTQSAMFMIVDEYIDTMGDRKLEAVSNMIKYLKAKAIKLNREAVKE